MEIGLKVNADKTKYMIMSRDKTAGRSHNIKIDNNSFERVEQFKYFVTTLKIQTVFRKKLRTDSNHGCLLPICRESFVFQVGIQKFKD
jgi:hypothetical protein